MELDGVAPLPMIGAPFESPDIAEGGDRYWLGTTKCLGRNLLTSVFASDGVSRGSIGVCAHCMAKGPNGARASEGSKAASDMRSVCPLLELVVPT